MARFGQDGMVVLNVAEKNDAAKRLSQIMSNGHSNRREGFSKFNKIYEFDYNLFNCNCKMAMTSVSGHLIDIQFSGAYTKWNQCPPVALFDAPVTRFVPDNFKDIKRTLEREVRRSQALIIWTDGDREGENIGFEIIEVCRQVKEIIDVYRARFSEITPRAVNQACRSLVRPDEDTSNAVEVRRELDLRIGASFTRFQTLRLQKKFPTVLAEQLISYGSCQFPTLGFVVARYKQVQEFLSEIFYKIKVTHTKDDCIANFVWQRGRVFNERICSLLTSMCQENPHATIVNTISKPKSKWRPVPLDTVELEKSASRKLRINAKETMKIAEKLYTNGIISYPRTETNIFPKGMDLNQLVQNQREDNQWGGFASGILANGGANPRQGKKTDNAHPPIHPIKYVNNLQGNEKRVYEFIVRHFLACVSKDAQGHETVFEIELAGEMFSVQGLVITERNYLDVYPYENWNNKSIPIYQQGETFTPDSIEMIKGETNPPPLLSEADLITLMEKHGIGTDATHADHIEKIKSRNYVGVQNDGTFLPGQLGMALVEGYDAMGFAMSKPHLRASLEADLVCICNGTKNHQDVLAHQIQSYKTVFEQTMFQVEKLDSALAQYFGEGEEVPDETNDVRKCPKCKAADMVLRKTKEAKWMLGCMGYPECRTSFFFPAFTLQCARSDQTCSQCSHTNNSAVHKIDFHFRRASVPPAIGERYTGCVGGCDEMLMGALSIREAAANRPAATQNNNNSRADLVRGAFNQAPNVGHGNQVNRARGRGNQGLGRGNQGLGRGNQGPHGGNQGRGRGKRGGKFNNDNNGGGSVIMSTNTRVPSGDNQVVCSCNKPTVQLTVRKDGPNQGRQFYKCSDSQCNFFLWSDIQLTQNQEGAQQNRGFGGTNNRNNNRSASFSTDEPTESVPCNCSQPATIRTVTKEGGNKGRQFYVCARGRDEQCKFFQWAEEEGVSRGASRGSGGGGGVGRGGGRGRKRKCGGCGQEGHTKRSCPFMK